MPFVKSAKDVTIRTTIGHVIQIPADTPTYVSPDVMKVAKKQGLVECDEKGENATFNEESVAQHTTKLPRDFTTLGDPPSRYGPTVMAEEEPRTPVVAMDSGLTAAAPEVAAAPGPYTLSGTFTPTAGTAIPGPTGAGATGPAATNPAAGSGPAATSARSANMPGPNAPATKPTPSNIPQLNETEQGNAKRREEVVRLAVQQIYRDNNSDDFTAADHRPKVKVVEQIVGFAVSSSELQAAVDRHLAEDKKR